MRMKRETKFLIVMLLLSLLVTLVFVILLKVYHAKRFTTNNQSTRRSQSEVILMNETLDEMEAQAQKSFKEVIDEYPAIEDPEFFKIESIACMFSRYPWQNEKAAQEYVEAKVLYREALTLKVLTKTDSEYWGFKDAYRLYFGVCIASYNYLLSEECRRQRVSYLNVDRVAKPLMFSLFRRLKFPETLDIASFQNLSAEKLFNCGRILKACITRLLKVLILASNRFPKEYPIDILMKLESKLQDFIEKTFKLN